LTAFTRVVSRPWSVRCCKRERKVAQAEKAEPGQRKVGVDAGAKSENHRSSSSSARGRPPRRKVEWRRGTERKHTQICSPQNLAPSPPSPPHGPLAAGAASPAAAPAVEIARAGDGAARAPQPPLRPRSVTLPRSEPTPRLRACVGTPATSVPDVLFACLGGESYRLLVRNSGRA
jgi:hypothetical protein